MTAPHSQPATRSAAAVLPALWIAFGVAVLWLAAHAAAPGGPPRMTWGVGTWERWPSLLRWSVSGALALLLAPPLLRRWSGAVAAAFADRAAHDIRRSTRVAGAVAFAALCWLGRSGNIYYGDGVIMAKIARSTETLRHYAGWSNQRANAEQVVEFLIHRGVNAGIGPRLGLDSYDTIALTHAACGGLMLYLLTGLFAAWWPRERGRQLAATALFLSLGVVQLWFGHIETYTLGSTAFVGFLYAGSRTLPGEVGLWRPALWATFAMTVHTVFGGLLLGLAWVWFVSTTRSPWPARLRRAAWLVLPLALAAAAVALAYRGLGFTWEMIAGFLERGEFEGATFVPLHETRHVMERYTFFSLGHLMDLVNESALTASYALPLLCGLLIGLRRAPFRRDPIPAFLIASTLVYFAVIVVINPPGGGRREWDVFSPPAIGYGLLAIYLLLTYVHDATLRRGLAAACIVAGAAHTYPWIIANARIDLPAYIEHRAAGSRAELADNTRTALLEYDQALRILPSPDLAVMCGDLARRLGEPEAALAYYRDSIRWENRSELAAFGKWEHALVSIAEILEARGDYAAARDTYLEAIRLAEERKSTFDERARAYAGLGRTSEHLGDMAAARAWYERALDADPADTRAREALDRLEGQSGA